MRIPATNRRQAAVGQGEPLLPMINVAVLLLVMLAIGARLEPADPVPVTLPQAEAPAGDTAEDARLFVAADGVLALGALRGDAALAALAPADSVLLHADATLPGHRLIALLDQLSARGVTNVQLVVAQP